MNVEAAKAMIRIQAAADLKEAVSAIGEERGLSFVEAWETAKLELPELFLEAARLENDRPPAPYRYVPQPALVQCQATFDLDAPTPTEIVYLPAGVHAIRPKVNGQPKDVTLTVDALAAQRLQRDLAKRLSQNVRPHGGFDHRSGAAAFVPKEFRWDPARGVILSVDWTRAGRKAVLGADYAYFSPTFLTDGSTVAGLPDTGEVGSLVNSPAFRDIPPITAA